MNKELMKTILLFFLVILSIFLTWNIWTYSPNIPESDQSDNYIEDGVAVNEEQVIKNIIKPNQIMFHLDGKHRGSNSDVEINSVLTELYSWPLYDFKDVSSRMTDSGFHSFLYQNGLTVLLFSDDIPFSLYKQMLEVEDKELPEENIGFDRIIIQTDKKSGNESKVYFVSTGKQQIYEFKVEGSKIDDFEKSIGTYAGELPEYKVTEIADDNYLYLPIETTIVTQYKYLPEMLNKQKFKDTLFADPGSVKRDSVTDGEEFTDGSSKMKLMNDTMTLKYVDPSKSKGNIASVHTDAEILKISIDFVNEHSGWDDNYRLVSLTGNSQKSTARFRMYIQGIPVFNNQGMTEMIQDWETQELTRYSRPFFTLNKYLPQETSPVTLMSGQEALEEVKAIEGFDPEYLQDMAIGYNLNKLDATLVSLVPTWFYKYKGEWKPLTPDETGGITSGLE